jgi:hypothetical protein
MCSPATCRECGKATYTGCGNHVQTVLGGVPAAQRCTCDRGQPKASSGFTFSLFGRR